MKASYPIEARNQMVELPTTTLTYCGTTQLESNATRVSDVPCCQATLMIEHPMT